MEAHGHAFANNHTYYPPTPAEVDALASTIMQVVDPHLVKLILLQQEIIGFVLGFRDLSAGLKRAGGRLWPVGLTCTFAYNNPDLLLTAIDEDTACVILEPMTFDEPAEGFLGEVQAICRQHGALLIFDEMWTGFRLALGGAQEYFGVTPDLACYSKAIANGMPLAVLTGRVNVMRLLDQDVFFFSTFGGETLSLAAALVTLDVMEAHDAPAFLALQGAKLQNGYNQLADDLGLDESPAASATLAAL